LAGGLNAYGFAGGDPVNFSDPFGLCRYPTAPGLGSLKCVADDFIAGGKKAIHDVVASVEDHARIGLSGTSGHYTMGFEASKDGVEFQHALEVAGPSIGGSIDISAKGSVPTGALSGSINVHPPVVGKHLGLSFDFYRKDGAMHFYGGTLHIGGGVGIETMFSTTVDLPKQ
jgi:hypothetical protein